MVAPDFITIGIPVAIFVPAVTASWYVIRAANRVHSLLKDYPPHRHVNGKVVYPPDFIPAPIESLAGGK